MRKKVQGKRTKLEIVKLVLGATVVVLVIGSVFSLVWCAKELSMIKQNQLQFHVLVEDIQNDIRQIKEKITTTEQNQFKLQSEIRDIQNNVQELASNMSKVIESNQLELRNVIKSLQQSLLEMNGKISIIEQKYLEFQTLNEPRNTTEPVLLYFKELGEIDQIEAERLLNVAVPGRSIGRLPMTGFKLMVDSSRTIIRRWPDSRFAYSAKQMLASLPERYQKRYQVTEEEKDLSMFAEQRPGTKPFTIKEGSR